MTSRMRQDSQHAQCLRLVGHRPIGTREGPTRRVMRRSSEAPHVHRWGTGGEASQGNTPTKGAA